MGISSMAPGASDVSGFDVYYVEERRAGECMDENLENHAPFMGGGANARYFPPGPSKRFDHGATGAAGCSRPVGSAHVGLSR